MKEIIIYLDEHSTISANEMSELWLDFRSKEDIRIFEEEWHTLFNYHLGNWRSDDNPSEYLISYERLMSASYIHITNFRTTKRLRRGAYYALNVEIMKRGRIVNEENSAINILAFDFEEVASEFCAILFSEHKSLGRQISECGVDYDDESVTNIGFGSICHTPISHFQMKVANVGQANLNILSFNDKALIFYDLGAPIGSSKQELRKICDKYIDNGSVKCSLIVSHWDIDHYQCLKALSISEIQNAFWQVICPPPPETVTATRVFDSLKTALSNNVHCIRPPQRTLGSIYPQIHKFLQQGCISLYIGESSRNKNYSGITLFVDGSTSSTLFTGDSLLCQAGDVLCQECYMPFSKNHFLVVPHHGGDIKPEFLRYNTCARYKCFGAIVSVGRNNKYGHPGMRTMSYLGKIFNYNFHLTSLSGDFEIDLD